MDEQTERHKPDWASVQLDYEQSNGSLEAICERYGITAAQLRHRRERHGWTLRNDWGMRITPLINRMLRVLDGQVRELEKHMADPVDKNVALLGTMTKTLEKLMQLDEVQRAKTPGKQKDVSDLRNKLATRIEHLKQQR